MPTQSLPLFQQASTEGKDASWFFGLFGLDVEINNALVFLGIGIVVVALLSAIIALGVSGEQGKQKLKRKLPWAMLAALMCFMGLGLLDLIVTRLVKSGTEIDENKLDDILGG